MSTKNHAEPVQANAWYAWETEVAEPNWLLTYVDVLSVILAMLVVLLGQMAVRQLQPLEAENQVAANQKIESLPQHETPVPTSTTANNAKSRLVAAINQRFHNEVKVVQREQGVSLEIAEAILFRSGEAELLSEALPVLKQLAQTLQTIGQVDIAVEGHTDNRPIRGGLYRSNWELAAARANAVTRFLLEQGISPKHLRSVSYADAQPIADNRYAVGRAENRRVNLRVDFL
jgi:chemotaxis protein MotB